jgi:Protein of unknown function (DUF3180).
MRRSHATPLIGLGLAGAVVGFLIELTLVAGSMPMLVPPVSLPLTLVAIAAIVVGFAIPIYRAVHGKTRVHINPFRAMRVAVLAKASSLAGAMLTGAGLGVLVFLLSRSVLPAADSIALAIGATAGAIILLVGGLVAEWLCTLPPPRDDDPETVQAH